MSFLTAAIGSLITFFLLRGRGGIARHTLAFIVGTIVSLALFGAWIAIQLSGGPIGNYRNDVMAGIWAFAIGVTVLLQIVAMVIAMLLRRRAAPSV